MRIAYICMDPGIPAFGTKGASVHIQEVIRELRALGHEVALYAARTGEHLPDDLADLEVHHLPAGAQDPALRERAQGIAAAQAAQMVIDAGADLVYERYSLFSQALADITSALGIPGILEVNAPLIDEQRTHRHLVDEERAHEVLLAQAAAAAATICVSDPVASWVRQATAGMERAAQIHARIHTVPNGVSVRRITPQDEADSVVVTFVGTLKPWHGVADLLEAAAQATVDWSLRIIGDGPEREALADRATALGLTVDFRGAVAPQDMSSHLAGSAIGVAPYPDLGGQDQQYFSPLKVLEYMAAGLPVVASDVGQIPQLLSGVGILVEPSNPTALARQIDALAADPEARADLGLRSRERAIEQHSWMMVVRTILDHAGVADD